MTPACHDKLTWASRPGLGIIILHFVEKVVNFNFLIVLGVSVLLAQLHSTQQQQIDLTTTDVGIYCPWFPRSNNVSPLTKMSGSWTRELLSEQSWLSPLPFVLSLGETQQISLSKALKPFADVMLSLFCNCVSQITDSAYWALDTWAAPGMARVLNTRYPINCVLCRI